MTYIGIVNNSDGKDSSLEQFLSISSAATSGIPISFSSTENRGGLAIHPSSLPLNPTEGTLAMDSDDNNKFKWWDGFRWITAGE